MFGLAAARKPRAGLVFDSSGAVLKHCYTAQPGHKKRYQCKYCPAILVCTSSTRAVQHLTGLGGGAAACPSVPDDVAEAVRKLIEKNAADAKKTATGKAELAKRVGCGRQAAIDGFFGKGVDEAADLAVAMFFYECGISFNVARSDAWKVMWEKVRAAFMQSGGWKPPNYNGLRCEMLEKAEQHVEKLVCPSKACYHRCLTWS